MESTSISLPIRIWAACDGELSSGIGRAVAVLMAREGADVTIVYLPEEQVCADITKKMIENEGRQCHLFAGDLTKRETCRRAVEEQIKR